ncbi:MAG: SDR family oxidoreductase [Myxococcota bacterium]
MKTFEFTGKTVVVTGASGGIGEAFARALSRRGATLVLVARTEAKLTALAAELGNAYAVPVDLTEKGAARRVFDAVTARGLDVDVLVNNAGYGLHGPFDALPPASQREQIDLNVGALVDLTQLFLPAIQRRRGGIINVASVAGYQPTPYMAVYGATKAFVLSFSDALWAEMSPYGVRVLCVSPGVTETGFFERSGEGAAGGLAGKKASPHDVVRVALAAFDAGRSSVVHGAANTMLTMATRFFSRAFAARAIATLTRPKDLALPDHTA